MGELVGAVEAERPDSHKEEVAEPALVGKTLSHFGENLNDGNNLVVNPTVPAYCKFHSRVSPRL